MTTTDFLPLGRHQLDPRPDHDPIRWLLYSLWIDLVWTVERAMSVELHRRDDEPADENRELSYLHGDIDDSLQHLARLIELLQFGHRIDWQKPGPTGGAPPYFLHGGGAIRAQDVQTFGAHPLDPPRGADPVRFLLNAGKVDLVRLDEAATEYRRIRHTGGADAEGLTQRMSETARRASATLARAIELILLGHEIDWSASGPGVEELRTFKNVGEVDWFAAQHAATLCKMLRPFDYGLAIHFPERKWQLFSLACVRRVSHVISDERTRAFLDATERFVEGEITADELTRFRKETNAPTNPGHTDSADPREQSAFYALVNADRGDAQSAMHVASEARYAADDPQVEALAQVALVREVFGNPFRIAAAEPGWLTDTVTTLARGIYDNRTFELMPILGDALEDAGCANIDILDHCRGPHDHLRGCWVLDLVSGNHLPAPNAEGTRS